MTKNPVHLPACIVPAIAAFHGRTEFITQRLAQEIPFKALTIERFDLVQRYAEALQEEPSISAVA